jgi:hypothetical protein
MKRIKPFLFLLTMLSILSCSKKEMQVENSLTLIAFGPADSLNERNKGFSARVYCFIDFTNDSVLVRDKHIIYDPVTIVKTGYIKDINQNDNVKRVMKVLDSLENGVMVGKQKVFDSQYPELYCGWDIFVEYKNNGSYKWFYTSSYTMQSLNDLIIYVQEEASLQKSTSILINDDGLIAAIVNRKGFALNHPPLVKTIIKFLPPKVDSAAN